MKALNDIKNEVCQEEYDCTFLQACTFMNIMDMESIMNEVAKRYAQQCCEDLRERIAKEAKLKPYTYPDGYKSNEISVIDKDSIRNVEIILP